jgi:predicted nuclease with TOPRIM domain
MKKNRLVNQKDIQNALRYAAHDLPSLENKFRNLSNDVIDLEIKKKELENTITLQNTRLIDLGQVITQYQNAIYIKKEQLMKMDKQLVIQYGKSKSDKH